MSTQARIRKLIDELKEASYAYYQLDKPIMSDREYNEKYDLYTWPKRITLILMVFLKLQ